jgi:hypothetical protein
MRGQARRVSRRTSRRTSRRQAAYNDSYDEPQPMEGPAPEDITGQLKDLGELHSSGVLTDAEFESKKTDLLSRM